MLVGCVSIQICALPAPCRRPVLNATICQLHMRRCTRTILGTKPWPQPERVAPGMVPTSSAWRHSGQSIIKPDALSLLPHQRQLGRNQLSHLSGSDFLWVHRPRYGLLVNDCRCLPRGERARRIVLLRRVSRRWQTLLEPAHRDRGLLDRARIGSLVARLPRRQEVRLFCPQATGLSLLTQSSCAGPRRGLDHPNRLNALRESTPGIQAHSDGFVGFPRVDASAPG